MLYVSGLVYLMLELLFFFFQAEDGIRDVAVTGVQTCALPICDRPAARDRSGPVPSAASSRTPRPPVQLLSHNNGVPFDRRKGGCADDTFPAQASMPPFAVSNS